MTFKDYSDTLLALVNKADSMWNQFFATNAGVLIWLTSLDNDIPLKYRIFTTFIYIAYMLITLAAHLRAYKFLNLLLAEFKINIDDLNIEVADIPKNIKKLNYNNRHIMLLITYTLVIIFVNYILWTGYKQI